MMTWQLLFYDYVEGILDKRKPYRDDHLAHAERAKAAGDLVYAGAYGDPVTSGLFVLTEKADAEAFFDSDPYNKAGLVTGHRVEPWHVVVS